MATEEVLGFPTGWEGQPVASNYFAALAGKRTAHSSTTLVVGVADAGSCMQADSEAYHTNSKMEADQGYHQAAAAAGDFRTGCAKRYFAVARIGCDEADRIQVAVALIDFQIDLVDHLEVAVHTAAEDCFGGAAADLAADHRDCGRMVGVAGVDIDLDHLACGEWSVEDSS